MKNSRVQAIEAQHYFRSSPLELKIETLIVIWAREPCDWYTHLESPCSVVCSLWADEKLGGKVFSRQRTSEALEEYFHSFEMSTNFWTAARIFGQQILIPASCLN